MAFCGSPACGHAFHRCPAEDRSERFLAGCRRSLEKARPVHTRRGEATELFGRCEALLQLAESCPQEFTRSVLADDLVLWGVREGLIAPSSSNIAMIDIFTCE